MQPVINPAEPKDIVGYVREATEAEVDQALDSAVNNALSGSPRRLRSVPPFWNGLRC
jgi:delta 1-pyrroline-5-carboxylate dehydrogenase